MAARPNIVRGIDDDKKIFVGGTGSLMPKHLYDYFSYFGEVDRVRVFTNSQRVSRGFAIVLFASTEAVNSVLTYNDVHYIGERQIFPKKIVNDLQNRPKRNNEVPIDYKLFVGGLTTGITDTDLIQFFSTFGLITNVYTPLVPGRTCRQNFSIITFASPLTVNYLLSSFHRINIRGIKLNINRVHPKPGNETVEDMVFYPEQVAAPAAPPPVDDPHYGMMWP